MNNLTQPEILLQKYENRYTMFPIHHNKIYDMYKRIQSIMWIVSEIDFSKDRNDWDTKLNTNEQFFIKNILAFFSGSDGIVLENLAQRFMNEIDIPEVKGFYGFQIANEIVHSETYSMLIDTLITNEQEKTQLFNAIFNTECIKLKAEWALKWIKSNNAPFSLRLVAFAIVEGIFFSGSFCAIYWLKKRGILPGLILSNEFISRDEGLHMEFAILLYSMIQQRLSDEIIYEIFTEAVNIEKNFIINSIPCNLIGMNSDLMSQYIEYVADRLIVQLGYNRLYNSSNPFDFMELISIKQKTNFFESRVTEYSKAKSVNVFKILDDNF